MFLQVLQQQKYDALGMRVVGEYVRLVVRGDALVAGAQQLLGKIAASSSGGDSLTQLVKERDAARKALLEFWTVVCKTMDPVVVFEERTAIAKLLSQLAVDNNNNHNNDSNNQNNNNANNCCRCWCEFGVCFGLR